MKELFNIDNGTEAGAGILALSIGDHHFSYSVTNSLSTRLGKLQYFSHRFAFEDIISCIRENEIFRENYFKTVIGFDFQKHTLLPSSIDHENFASVLREVYNTGNNAVIVSENLSTASIANTYSIPSRIMDFTRAAFPSALTMHRVTLDMRYVLSKGNELQVDFSPAHFSTLVTRNGQIELSRSFEYESPEDVIYWLLKIIRHCKLDQDSTTLTVSGLIERNSVLADQLHLYFQNISFTDSGWSDDSGMPAHFFTSLNRLSRCE